MQAGWEIGNTQQGQEQSNTEAEESMAVTAATKQRLVKKQKTEKT
jgi:hypothetical protein